MGGRDSYFARLGAYRDGEADLCVDYIARCAFSACRAASESATTLAGLPRQWRDAVNPCSGSAALKLIDSLRINASSADLLSPAARSYIVKQQVQANAAART